MTSGALSDGVGQLARLLPEYSIERELGRGAMGVVYLARHQRLDRLVAVKELQGALAADAGTRERFSVEARSLASLNHPHVVPVFDYVERDDHCVLVMEQLPGGTVWDRFVDSGLTMPQATAITLATCSAMQHAHEEGILHRDIKPENLMFDVDGVLKVTDFGIARMVNGAGTKATVAGSVLGTPAYMAPEQAEGHAVGPPADVYATATMFYEMLSGRLPFDRSDSLVGMLTQRITSEPLPLRSVAEQVPAGLAEVTMHGLARSMDRRIATAELLGTMLAEAAVDAWGVGWLDASGLVVRGSERIGRAARTLREGEVRRPSGDVTGGARGTVVAKPGSPEPSSTGRVADATVTPETASRAPGDGAVDADRGATTDPPTAESNPSADSSHADNRDVDALDHAAQALAASADLPTVKPLPTDRQLGRAKAADIDRLIDISEVLAAPARPVAQYAIAAILFVAGLAWALVGGGSSIDTIEGAAANVTVNGQRLGDPEVDIEIDLSEPIIVDGFPPGLDVSMSFEQMGVPVGSTDTFSIALPGPATLDAGFLGNVTSGSMIGTIEATDPTLTEIDTGSASDAALEFEVTAANPWFLTAAGVISLLVILFALAGIESNLRAFRRGRSGVLSFVGLLVTGGLFGGAAAGALTIIAGTSRGPVGLAGPAALCAAGAVALGLATRANRARRRAAKQSLRHTAIAALASK